MPGAPPVLRRGAGGDGHRRGPDNGLPAGKCQQGRAGGRPGLRARMFPHAELLGKGRRFFGPREQEVSLLELRPGTRLHANGSFPCWALRSLLDSQAHPGSGDLSETAARGLNPLVVPFPSVCPLQASVFSSVKWGCCRGQVRTWHRARALKATPSAAWWVCFGWWTSLSPSRGQLCH